MLLSHARTLCDARSALAVLADRAVSSDASSAYEHVLITLDVIHGDEGPVIDTYGLPEEHDQLLAITSTALERLKSHGVDNIHVELLLAMLDDATELDVI